MSSVPSKPLKQMITFDVWDIIVLVFFFAAVLLTGFLAKGEDKESAADYLLSGRKVGLLLFVLTNVSTWYGGILGVGEFTYRYGIVSWFTQGFPYYVFAILFAIFFAKKIRESELYTIPDKLEKVYGRKTGLISAVIIFLLVTPAPYVLMIANLFVLIFDIPLLHAIVIGVLLSSVYLFKGGYKSDIYTDALEFFVMFAGFIIIFIVAQNDLGSWEFIKRNVPPAHLTLTGNTSITFVIVWFLIALWTFTDPGFHQRCYAAKNGKVAMYGLIISVFFWAAFDFLTTATGLYSRAALPDLENPIYAFPLLAEKLLSPGIKGIFYAALFATILSTLNSFLFLSATTFGRDFVFKLKRNSGEAALVKYTKYGLILTVLISIPLAYYVQSIIQLWYIIGSILIPGIILLILGAYYPEFKISEKYAVLELISGVFISFAWFFIREQIPEESGLKFIEPMIAGLAGALIIHLAGLRNKIKKRI